MTEYVRGRTNPALQGMLKKARGNSVVKEIASDVPAAEDATPAGMSLPVQAPAPVQAPPEDAEAPQAVPAPVQAPPAAYAAPAPQPAPAPAEAVPGTYAVQAQAQAPAFEAVQPPPVPAAPQVEPAPEPKVKMVKTSVRHTEDDAARVRATYIATMRQHRRRSMSDWLNDVVLAECARLEAELNGGQPFDEDPELPRGRPIMG